MKGLRRISACRLACVLACAVPAAHADNGVTASADAPPAVYVVELGAYGVFEPTYEGSKRYGLGFKPIFDFSREGDKVWLSFPNDAISYDFYETANFHAGAAGAVTLRSRFHGEDIDLHLGKADVDLQGGAFVEYYPFDFIRTRVEFLQGLVGSNGLVFNLSADYIWRPTQSWVLTLGPRAQLVDDAYASDYFSMRIAQMNHTYVKYTAEGGLLSSGVEMTGTYDWTKQISTKFFVDYNRLMGDAADSPKVSVRGSTDQITVGVGASYKFKVGN